MKNLVNQKKVFSAVGGYYQGLTRGEGSVYFFMLFLIKSWKLKM